MRTDYPRPAKIRRFNLCGAMFYVLQSTTDPTLWKIVSDTCRDRWCIPCARHRAATITANLLPLIQGKEIRMLTLTLQANATSLRAQLDKLLASFSTLRRSAVWQQHISGGAAMIEITRGRNEDHWHPHLHILVEGQFFPKQLLRAAWETASGGSYIVDLRRVWDPESVVHYVTKYATKPAHASLWKDQNALQEAMNALRGRKLLISFGTWQHFNLLTPPSTGEWTNYGHVFELDLKSRQGDLAASAILHYLTWDIHAAAGEPFYLNLAGDIPP